MSGNKLKEVDEYLDQFEASVKSRLELIRQKIIDTVPEAEESISYGMPAYKYKKKPLVYFAGYQHHIGIYATPNAHDHFAQDLKSYKQGKGSVQFPLDKTLPLDLILKMVIFNKESIDNSISSKSKA